MKEFKAGTYILHKGYKPFVPSFINEDIDWKLDELSGLLQDASLWLGKLNSYADLIPDIDFFIKMYATKEATNSNRIEGTRTTFEDAISPVEQVKPELRDDWHEVQNYIQAINYSVERLKDLPLSIRLLKEAHKILLQGVRGEHKTPGEIRKTQNWIGGSSLQDAFFIPPEPNLLPELLSDIEKFLHNDYLQVPELIRAGIAHYQFETIHPFLDGNGRTGRLLIILYLISTGLLNKPVLYISDFFERNRMSYYDSLSMVKQNDNITQWLKFFLNGVIETSKNSIKTFDEIIKLKKDVENKLTKIGKKAANGQRLLELLYSKPKVNSKLVSEELDVSKFGLLFAGAQKNLAPAGVTLVIIREDLICEPEACRAGTPTMLCYKTHADNDSMYNTPPCYTIYVLGKVLHWIEANGGAEGMLKRNKEKADYLYNFLDSSDFYHATTEKGSRSLMNVPFLTKYSTAETAAAGKKDEADRTDAEKAALAKEKEINDKFVKEAAAAGLVNLKGHRLVGGMRASIYNAMTLDGVKALVDFMKKFAEANK